MIEGIVLVVCVIGRGIQILGSTKILSYKTNARIRRIIVVLCCSIVVVLKVFYNPENIMSIVALCITGIALVMPEVNYMVTRPDIVKEQQGGEG